MMKAKPQTISPARKAAFDALMAVARGSAHADDLLRGASVSALSAADRNLATALVLGVLRWQIRLDREIAQRLARPGAKLDTPVRIALRLGAFQLLLMDRIPPHAAIDESVELAKRAGHQFASRMVNAVLRKIATASRAVLSDEDAIQAHPAWLVERWASFYGSDAATAICRHGQMQPTQTLRIADAATERELAESGIRLEPGELLTSARIVVSGDLTATPAFREGCARLQDEGSQLIAEIAAHSNRKPATILDACAAPGGKTLILAERNPQAKIVACEWNAQRLAALQARLAFLGDRVTCRKADAAALADDSAYDLVLADVPCSGTGTLGRNPEIRHRLQLDDLPRQSERQKAILHAALRATRPGGRVVYSTCSLEPEENEQVVAAVLARRLDAHLIPAHDSIQGLMQAGIVTDSGAERLRVSVTAEGYLRLLPGAFRTDGFFVAIIERI
ncbi:MAG TPA: transcription antitermination factor NusB [Terracidiphilus sp.]|nr:transcription antitermination factor NusB [Terracidiphilus sp.]